jgi:hypothetical protein
MVSPCARTPAHVAGGASQPHAEAGMAFPQRSLQDLEHRGLVRSEGEGPQPRYWITEVGRQLVAEQEAHIG